MTPASQADQRPLLIAYGQEGAHAIAADNDHLCWAKGDGKILLVTFGQSGISLVTSDAGCPMNLKIIGPHIYWLSYTQTCITLRRIPLEGGAPCFFIGPLGIAHEATVAVAMQSRSIAAVNLGDEFRAAMPCLAELLFLARMDAPPVDRDKHAFLLHQAFWAQGPAR